MSINSDDPKYLTIDRLGTGPSTQRAYSEQNKKEFAKFIRPKGTPLSELESQISKQTKIDETVGQTKAKSFSTFPKNPEIYGRAQVFDRGTLSSRINFKETKEKIDNAPKNLKNKADMKKNYSIINERDEDCLLTKQETLRYSKG